MTTSCWGDVVFTEKNFMNIRAISWMEDLRDLGIRGAEGLEGFFTSLHYYITTSLKKVQSSTAKALLSF